jgi:hypothetical protein
MATPTMGSPIKKLYGETASLTTTALHLGFMPDYHEVLMYCTSNWRMGIAPKLACVKYYNGTSYVNYTSEATDRSSSTHVPLDGMTTAKYLYLGVTAPTRGFYFTKGSNAQDAAATLDMEYLYDVSDGSYLLVTGTVSGALTVAETVTGGTSSATATVVYSGATSIVVKSVVGSIAIGETLTGAAQNISAITAIEPVAVGTGYFTDVASDSDGTDSAGDTLKVSGLYSFTLPSVIRGGLAGISNQPLYWYRFAPSATLTNPTDIAEIYPACDTTNYAYMEGGISYQFALNTSMCGAFEFDHTSSGTLDISWIQH